MLRRWVYELLAGETGFLAGGLIGSLTAGGISSAISTCEPGNAACAMGAFLPAIVVGSIAGGIGTGLAVVYVGRRIGVAGNELGAYVGPFLGLAVAVGLSGMLAQFVLVALAITPVAFSVIGYNIGTKMEDTG